MPDKKAETVLKTNVRKRVESTRKYCIEELRKVEDEFNQLSIRQAQIVSEIQEMSLIAGAYHALDIELYISEAVRIRAPANPSLMACPPTDKLNERLIPRIIMHIERIIKY